MVLLTLKNLQQQSFNVEICLSASVKELKLKIEKEKGADYPADGQKLIYAGKILQDDNILETYNIDAKKFLVIMVTKPKVPLSSAPTDPTIIADEPNQTPAEEEDTADVLPEIITTAAGSSDIAPTTTTTTTAAALTSTTTSTTTSSSATEESTESAESLIVMGEEFNRMVENIMEMGYERTQVERALRASFNNPYTAVQYLVDGIPANLEFSSSGGNPPAVRQDDEAEGEEAEDPLEFLRSQPQFNQMRQMIRSNPQLLDAFVQQIGQTNPELLRTIQQNQEAFVRMINESNPPSSGAVTGSSGGSGTGTGTTPSSGSPRLAPDQNAILVSPQDRDAIQRLRTLGNFPEDVVIQAYFACEKNENLAAEFLFSQTWD